MISAGSEINRIEEAFRNLKSSLNLDRLINKSQQQMEQTLALPARASVAALVMLAFSTGFLTGGAIRDELYAPPDNAHPDLDPPLAATHMTRGLCRASSSSFGLLHRAQTQDHADRRAPVGASVPSPHRIYPTPSTVTCPNLNPKLNFAS
jgi:hypothetical protein